jgi:peptidyl-prolyl cis-trans isomerase SurA
MKNILFVFGLSILTLSVYSQQDPILMKIDNQTVTKSEFLQIYLKNNNNPQFDKTSLDEYMELFKKFKLKVAEAEKLGYDTIPKLKKELEGYRKQLALPYMVDSAKNQAFVKEAYERMKQEVHAAHILIRIEANATPADTLKVYKKIMALKKRIEAGEDFSSVAKGPGGSEDQSVQSNGGDLGYFTAFQMVYPFEDAAYKAEIGKVTSPVRTRFGYHLILVKDKRAARGTLESAHIMVAVKRTDDNKLIVAAEKKINEIHAQLIAGESFEDLAKNYSDDPSSANKGGVLPNFGTGTTTRMVPEFEDAAFALKENGDFSEPIRTDYGFHIVKRIDLLGLQSFESLQKELQNKVNRDERSIQTQDSYLAILKKEYNFKEKYKKNSKWFIENIDSNFFKANWKALDLKKDKTMFSLDGQKFGQRQFANYLENSKRGLRKDDVKTLVYEYYTKWQKQAILDYEESKLPVKYPEFKALLKEYHDGILLYEIMSEKVWNKAIMDTSGLQVFYDTNKSNYMWGTRLNSEVYECLNNTIADRVYTLIQNDTITSAYITEQINKESELNLRVRQNKFDKEQTAYLKDQKLKKGNNTVYEYDGKFYIVKVLDILPPAQKELNEAKGSITSDYQNYLEQEWLKSLDKTHTITINETILYSLGK